MLKKLLVVHRWLGVIACLAVLMFAGSGLLHPLMSRSQPQPVQRTAPSAVLTDATLSLVEVLRRHAIDNFSAASVIGLPIGSAYRVQIDAQHARYFVAADGGEIANGEYRHAEFLARHFSGEQRAKLLELSELTQFDNDYLWVNHLLPVWRARFDRADGLTVYVDTRGNRLATLLDNRKRLLQTTFRNMHDFAFLQHIPWLRLPLMLVLLCATFCTSAAGLALFVKLKNPAARLRRLPARRWHRRLALLVSCSTLTFSISGSWHLLQSEIIADTKNYASVTEQFKRSELDSRQPRAPFTLARSDGMPCYRVAITPNQANGETQEHHHPLPTPTDAPPPLPATANCYRDSTTPIIDADRRQAIKLARAVAATDAALASSAAISQFGGEYGFINKRLPVWKIVFADSATRWYVETSSGALALRADDSAALEGFFFAYVHKWIFIGDAHKDLRDGLLISFALLNIFVALLGLQLFIKRLYRSPMRAE